MMKMRVVNTDTTLDSAGRGTSVPRPRKKSDLVRPSEAAVRPSEGRWPLIGAKTRLMAARAVEALLAPGGELEGMEKVEVAWSDGPDYRYVLIYKEMKNNDE